MAAIDVKKTLTDIGDMIAAVMLPEHDESALEATILGQKPHASTIRVTLGARSAVLKLFANNDLGRAAFDRERRALDGFQGVNVPRLLFVSKADRAVLTTFIAGDTLSGALTETNLLQMAEFMGQWFGRLAQAAPKSAIEGSWHDYLSRYPGGFDADLLEAQKPLMDLLHPAYSALAHNDNALGNFVLGKDKKLYGLDFEDTRFKPEGWDLITATRALFLRFPQELQAISNSLIRGYDLVNPGATLPAQFDQLINVLVVANLVEKT